MSYLQDLAEQRRGMIRRFLEQRGLRFFTDCDGDFLVRFRCEKRTVEFMIATDSRGEVVWFESTASTRFRQEDVPLLLVATNSYTLSQRWPRLKVVVEGSEAFVVTDGHLLALDSAGQEQLEGFLECALSTTLAFWEEFTLPNMEALDDELDAFLGGTQDGSA